MRLISTFAVVLFAATCFAENPNPGYQRYTLWDSAISVTGDHLKPRLHMVGAPVSAAIAIDYLQCDAIANGRRTGKFRPTNSDYFYRVAREIIRPRGFYPEQGVFPEGLATACLLGRLDDTKENQVALDYGGPPAVIAAAINDRLVSKTVPVDKLGQCIVAMQNRNPVLVTLGPGFVYDEITEDGKLYARPQGRWAHIVTMSAYDPDGRNGAAFCLDNCWPLSKDHVPQDGAPPDSFWIDEDLMSKILAEHTAYEIVGIRD